MATPPSSPAVWQKTACILCSRNCGLEVQVVDGQLKKIRGDEAHPQSKGYLCQKAARLDHYQQQADRLTSPLRRRADGTFEPISWETAIAEVAAKLKQLRDVHSGRSLAYYGGGGQGNHLGGVYGSSLLRALGTRYHYSALAQEKTGDFWVNGELFGRQTCHITEDVEHADMVLFIGTNPWQAHGIPNARDTLKAIQADPARTMVVIDPRRSETARLADIHLRVRPGTDAFLMAAMLSLLVRENLQDSSFIGARTVGFDAVKAVLMEVPVEAYVARAGVALAQVQDVVHRLATAKKACVRVDLGLQQSLHSTLNSYLEKLLFLLTGHFGRPGCNNLHTYLLPLIGHSDTAGSTQGRGAAWTTTVTGMPEISKLFPPNVLPAEIDSDHPGRLRGLIVDSANPIMSAADTPAYLKAFRKLELLVVIDVAFTETAREAHYILPAASQFEKWEATFFNLEFPTNGFHLRRPILPPLPGTLPEPEIYHRLLVALGALPARFPMLEAIATLDRRTRRKRLFSKAFAATLTMQKRLVKLAPMVLYATLGKALPDGAQAAAVLWGACLQYAQKHGDAVRRTGLQGRGEALGEALFERILSSPSGTLLSTHTHEDTWQFLRHDDKRIHLAVPKMLDALRALQQEALIPLDTEATDKRHTGADGYPFVLTAGERRSYNANTIYRDPKWRKNDPEGALHIHPDDAQRLGLQEGAWALCTSKKGEITVKVALSDDVLPGLVTLPHGYGLDYPENGARRVVGPALNLLTDAADRDPITATPHHKYVRVRLSPAAPLGNA